MTKPDHIRVILETGHGDDWTRLCLWEGDTGLGPTLDLWQRIVRLLSEVQQPHDHGACTICEMQMRRIAELEGEVAGLTHHKEWRESFWGFDLWQCVLLVCMNSLLTERLGIEEQLLQAQKRIAELEAREHAVNETQTNDALDTIRALCAERTQLQADLRTAAEQHLDTLRKLYAAQQLFAAGTEIGELRLRIAELERDKAA